MLDHVKLISTMIEAAALIALGGATAAGAHYDGLCGGTAAFSAALLVFALIHAVHLGVTVVWQNSPQDIEAAPWYY